MHPRFMKRSAVVFAGGALCSALLACVVHDDTNFPNPPQPGDAASPTRIVVDSGVVILSEDDGGSVPVGGAGGEFTPDAAALPDLSPDLATAELGGIGSICDLFGKNPTYCGTRQRMLREPGRWHRDMPGPEWPHHWSRNKLRP